jgi:hypothetical protein
MSKKQVCILLLIIMIFVSTGLDAQAGKKLSTVGTIEIGAFGSIFFPGPAVIISAMGNYYIFFNNFHLGAVVTASNYMFFILPGAGYTLSFQPNLILDFMGRLGPVFIAPPGISMQTGINVGGIARLLLPLAERTLLGIGTDISVTFLGEASFSLTVFAQFSIYF